MSVCASLGNFLAQLLLICLISFSLAGCTGSGDLGNLDHVSPGGRFSAVKGTEAVAASGGLSDPAAASASRIFASKGTAEADGKADYKISSLDVLEVTVLNVPDLSKTVQVSATGNISLPLANSIQAAGKTTSELEKSIATRLKKTYLQSPQVSVFIKEYNSQKITVDGAVNKPGIYPKDSDATLLQAIALAQGLTLVADPTAVLIFRTVSSQRQVARFDLQAVRAGKLADPKLLAGDIVMVDESTRRTTMRDLTNSMPLTGLFTLLRL